MPTPVTVILLTYNEELNLPHALGSVCGWADQVIVLDSFSTDRTVEIALAHGCEVDQRAFDNYASQRNHALSLPIRNKWVLFLDADEWLPEDLKCEIAETLQQNPRENGFFLKQRLIWMGCWIRRGYYPTWIVRLFRYGKGRCEERGINEHLIVDPPLGHLRCDFIHEDRKGLAAWIAKHVAYARREAVELRKAREGVSQEEIPLRLFGPQRERKRWVRAKVWNRLPPLLRPWLYFFYRVVLRGGCFDGPAAISYHFLQALWYPMLIDVYSLADRWNVPVEPERY